MVLSNSTYSQSFIDKTTRLRCSSVAGRAAGFILLLVLLFFSKVVVADNFSAYSPRFAFDTRNEHGSFEGYSQKFTVNTFRDIQNPISGLSTAFVLDNLRGIKTQIQGDSDPFTIYLRDDIMYVIDGLSGEFDFDTRSGIAREFSALSNPFPMETSGEQPVLAFSGQSNAFAFNTDRGIENLFTGYSNSFGFGTSSGEWLLSFQGTSEPFNFNTLKNIAIAFSGLSNAFFFSTSSGIIDLEPFTGQSVAFLFDTWRNVVLQIMGLSNEFYFSGDGSPLPVELLSFTALPVEDGIKLDWQTASEINNDFFTLFRSRNGVDFTSIGTKQGAGNSNLLLSYSYTDQDPLNGINYYQLKQTDFDGSTSYSQIVAAMFYPENDAVIFYANDFLHVVLPWSSDVLADYTLFDTTGRVLKKGKIHHMPGEQKLIGVHSLPKGVFLVAITGNHDVFNKKIFKY